MREQHDDHCWLTAWGFPVKIMWMNGVHELAVAVWLERRGAFEHGLRFIDLSQVDWSYYHAVYKRRLGEAFAEDV